MTTTAPMPTVTRPFDPPASRTDRAVTVVQAHVDTLWTICTRHRHDQTERATEAAHQAQALAELLDVVADDRDLTAGCVLWLEYILDELATAEAHPDVRRRPHWRSQLTRQREAIAYLLGLVDPRALDLELAP